MVKVREAHPVLPDGSIDIKKWLERISANREYSEIDFIEKACALAQEFGRVLPTSYGEPCFNQGLVMAEILHELGLDADTLAAAIIHHTYQYGDLSLERITNTLNENVVKLVQGVQKIDEVPANPTFKQVENLRRMLLSIVDDVRVVLIKLASHTCELRAAVNLQDDERRKIALETQEIYAPLANRLGIGQIKWELEDFSFRFLEPLAYKQIASLLDERRTDREEYIEKVVDEIAHALQLQGIEATVFGRAKHIYSIWKKMQRKGVSYHEIYDVRAIRMVVNSVRDCYAALGVVHVLWQHIPKEFDDYIANPKTNGYRSLHTAVIGPEGKTLEVQIRTPDMHEQAELGVAAHWRYKENVNRDALYEAKLANLRQVLKWQEEWPIDQDASDIIQSEVFQDRVYVLTPKGEIINLPIGASVLDFAYHVHTEIGNRCRGAKVNGVMVPLVHSLKSGDRVEILTARSGGPSRDWLNRDLGYLKTARARAKALQWFKKQDRDQNIQEGRETLERDLKRLGIDNLNLENLAHALKITKVDDMLASLGSGDIKISQVIGAIQTLLPPILSKNQEAKNDHYVLKTESKHKATDVTVMGVGNLLCHMARCCKPVPGDEIIGYITVGRGVSVHRRDCLSILQAKLHKQSRLIQVEWGGHIQNQYNVDVVIKAYDREGLLRDITAILAGERVNVIAVNALSGGKDNTADFKLTLEIPGLNVLSKILSRIQQLPNVTEVKRITNTSF